MSQMVTRKGPVGEDKEKGQSTDTPVKEMKKKMAANAEKEKQAAEKHGDKDKEKEKDKPAETKQPEKAEKNVEKKDKLEKASEKKEKQAEKGSEKKEKSAEKGPEKKEKPAEKEKLDKSTDKKSEAPAEKPKEDKNAKPDKPTDKDNKEKEKDKKCEPATPTPTATTPKPKQNGSRANGTSGTTNGEADSEGTVSSDEELVIIDHERDDMFPELAYEDSDGEFEPPTPEGLPSRSYTRRSQAKAARTPETPRPASDKRADRDDDSKEAKVLKLKEDTPSTDRKLRSSDSPKPESKKEKKTGEKETADKPSPKKKDLEVPEAKDDEGKDKSTVEIVIDVDMDEGAGGAGRKEGTNYSRSRVKVSPYRRNDHTASSLAANYTGNNTTMEMDITESSYIDDTPTQSVDSPYLSGLRSIRGRRSYKPLKEMAVRNVGVSRSVRSTTSIVVTEHPHRPTAPVVGRKRKPEGEGPVELAREAGEGVAEGEGVGEGVRGKRARLLEKLARPFRAVSTPLPVRRNAEIVGINTDLPLTAPVATPDTFDPESLKASPAAPVPEASPPGLPGLAGQRDNKRCAIM